MAQTSFVAENLEGVREQIARAAKRAGRRAEEITIVAVSKTFPVEAIRAAHDAGLRHFGENRIQEFEAKHAKVAELPDATWHFIGHLQSNKAQRAARLFDRIDSVDSLSLAHKLDAAAATEARLLPVLIEVRLSHEATKSGVSESDLAALAASIQHLPQLELKGLLTVPPYSGDPEKVRPYFRKLRELRDSLRQQLGAPLPILSMGMSHDFEAAIEEGATEVRLGTVLFGERKQHGG